MRGLFTFIRDVRSCDGARAKEDARVAKELAHIRNTFKEAKKVDNYSRKKYVAKLVYIHLLGYEVDFGHMEALALLSSPTYHEKQIGYMALAILLHEKHDLLTLIVNCAKKDLESPTTSEPIKCLALSAVAHIGGVEMAENMGNTVLRALTVGKSSASLKQRAALCLLRLHERLPDVVPPDPVVVESITKWFRSKYVGVVLSVVGLATGVVSRLLNEDKADELSLWLQPCLTGCSLILQRIYTKVEYRSAYEYHGVMAPWLSVATLGLLRLLPPPAAGSPEAKQITSVLRTLFSNMVGMLDKKKHDVDWTARANSRASILFEAIFLLVDWQRDDSLAVAAANTLSQLLTAKSANLQYLTLDAMARFADARLKASRVLLKHEDAIIAMLGNDDISIRRRALDCLYSMCNTSNAKRIVGQLLVHLLEADFELREELVLKAAILAEKFATVYSWYVDVILQLISLAGDFVSDTIWHRVVQIISNHADIQSYAASTCYEALNHPSCHELTVKVGAYVLGEFGHFIADDESGVGPSEQFSLLLSKYDGVEADTQAMLMTAFAKMANLYPELQKPVLKVLKGQLASVDPELQQRAVEYSALVAEGDEVLLDSILDAMPSFPEKEFNLLEGVQKKQRRGTGSAAAAVAAGEGIDNEEEEEKEEEEEEEEDGGDASTGDGASDAGADTGAESLDEEEEEEDEDEDEGDAGETEEERRAREKRERKERKRAAKRAKEAEAAAAAASSASHTIVGGGLGLGVRLGDPAAAAVANAKTIALEGPVEVAWKRLLPAEGHGVLYEDGTVSVVLQQRFGNGRGDLRVAVTNRSSGALGDVGVKLVSDGVTVTSTTSTQQGSLDPNATAIVTFTGIASPKPFATPASLVVSHSRGGVRLHSPITVHKFCMPLVVAPANYLTQWKAISGGDLEIVRDIRSRRAIDVEFCKAALRGLLLEVLDGIDPVPTNLVAAGAYVPADGPRVPVMVRLQTSAEAKMYRLSIKTRDGALTAGLAQVIEKVLQGS